MSSEKASVLSKSKTATLTNLVSREKAKKPQSKNLLCQELHKWPRPDKSVEEDILCKLKMILRDNGNIFKGKQATEQQKESKAKIRSQLDIGVSSVFRSLEKDALSCVLVSGHATPAITVEHVITLARERGCPLLCLDELASSIAQATESKCLPLAIGFKKVEDETEAVFQEIVTLVKDNTEVKKPSSTKPPDKSASLSLTSRENVEIRKDTPRPLTIDVESKDKILDELHRIFSQAQVTGEKQNKANKKKKKKKIKKNLKDVINKSCGEQFELGKRSVQYVLGLGKLKFILVSDILGPILTLEAATPVTSPSCLLTLASKKSCPVVSVPGLTDKLRPLFGGGISVLGIKKLSTLLEDKERHFETLIDQVQEAVDAAMKTENSTDSVQTKSSAKRKDKPIAQSKQNYVEKDYSYLYISKKDSKELQDKIRKRKAEEEKMQKQLTFSSDFISLKSDSLSGTREGASDEESAAEPEVKKSKISEGNDESGFISLDSAASVDVKLQSNRTSTPGESSSISSDMGSNFETGGRERSDSVEDSNTSNTVLNLPLFSLDRKGGPSQSSQEAKEGNGVLKSEQLFCVDTVGKQSTEVEPEGDEEKMEACAESMKTEKSHKNDKATADAVIVKRDTKTEDFIQFTTEDRSRSESESQKEPTIGSSSGEDRIKPDSKNVLKDSHFLLDRSGNEKVSDVKKESKKESQSAGRSGLLSATSEIMGDLEAREPDTGFNILAMHQPRTKGIGAKRKLQSQDGFISFAYTEANIKTMVANPSKKRKKKKKK